MKGKPPKEQPPLKFRTSDGFVVFVGRNNKQNDKLSLKTAIGSAKMIEQSSLSVEQLISNVATKGGCTAVGVDYMNEIDTEKIFAELIKVTTEKAASLG